MPSRDDDRPVGNGTDRRGGKPNSSLYVRGVAEETRNEELKEMFAKFGPVKDVYIPLDYYTRRARGFAYVQFEELRDAEDALAAVDGTRLHGMSLEVEFAQGDRKTPNDMKGKERGGGGGRNGNGAGRRDGRNGRGRYDDRRGDRDRDRGYSRERERSRDRGDRRRRSRSGDRDRRRSDRDERDGRERRRSPSPRRRSPSPKRRYSRSPSRSPRHSPRRDRR
ncbi:hypothetical protein RvY_03243-1 [Ramazzottius varieornatus]|uniref:RRM domain-containing protein n=1 Tax=Ramazzottius varieornatus TaxID=947166 RepID=A0A1D1UR54_RAMVA|nr:hypothetical protein RvY_03243-1 [Ramazzottius varieornatus]